MTKDWTPKATIEKWAEDLRIIAEDGIRCELQPTCVHCELIKFAKDMMK